MKIGEIYVSKKYHDDIVPMIILVEKCDDGRWKLKYEIEWHGYTDSYSEDDFNMSEDEINHWYNLCVDKKSDLDKIWLKLEAVDENR